VEEDGIGGGPIWESENGAIEEGFLLEAEEDGIGGRPTWEAEEGFLIEFIRIYYVLHGIGMHRKRI
jgi:hypothetical protein